MGWEREVGVPIRKSAGSVGQAIRVTLLKGWITYKWLGPLLFAGITFLFGLAAVRPVTPVLGPASALVLPETAPCNPVRWVAVLRC
jgi:hypothetical protein